MSSTNGSDIVKPVLCLPYRCEDQMSSSFQPTASMYDGVYARKLRSVFLDKLDMEVVGDDAIALLKCTGFLAKGDLAHYKRILMQHISRHLYTVKQKTLLDLGCGFGGLGRWLANELNLQLVGIDFSNLAIEQARAAITESEVSQTRFEAADFCSTGLATESISAVISLDALYLAENPMSALKEVHRILMSNGILIFTVYLQLSGKDSEDFQSDQLDWHRLAQDSGFLITQHKDVTARWRSQMQRKHKHRWTERERIRDELGVLAEAELSVSTAMLGLHGRPSFLESVSRFEVVAIRV